MPKKSKTKKGKTDVSFVKPKGPVKEELLTNKIIAKRINTIAESMVKEINKDLDPTFTTKIRGLNNVWYNEKEGYLELGDKTSQRHFLNVAHARKFMQTTIVMDKTSDYLTQNKTANIREIYYELKHTIKDTKENTFEDQTESDGVLVDLEHSVDTIREKLNLKANPKGALYGDITLVDKAHHNDTFNCRKLGRGGWKIMSRIEPDEITIKSVDADFLLVVETAAMYERLIEEDFARKNRAILIASEGQAARGTRRLIHRIHMEKKLPVIVFTDGDPYGWYIYSTIKYGSMALAAHSKFLAVPGARFVGMTLNDIEDYGLEKVTERMKEGDIKRAKEMMDYSWFKNKEWQAQLKLALSKKLRIEQQALANKSLDFVAKEYLPQKIKEKNFLP
ncbi:MAG: DNA topoisomerase IV subunit A [archaeon]